MNPDVLITILFVLVAAVFVACADRAIVAFRRVPKDWVRVLAYGLVCVLAALAIIFRSGLFNIH